MLPAPMMLPTARFTPKPGTRITELHLQSQDCSAAPAAAHLPVLVVTGGRKSETREKPLTQPGVILASSDALSLQCSLTPPGCPMLI